ncbi:MULTISPECIES: thiamine pyrophosphate-binding protein [unclassified Solwaraspora]|uniref:thiamine pyrophosphate-binding protein n=1 Tax=unclassified Solwaraspora TaxID=2627926 RepID=UPI00248CD475|nr:MULTISPECIES: thiamine pyrophosphate-binding protein [unclassified Solwaraspora]WBB99676.1 thiamine pyrophosphate-binding protein [Solwaraspora sp. WMMA2059]WBC21774.1 thiamine pyrophosphate-binding protein [Solwaraspora sp. WMMA2080]WJK36179.1 thiamine pyrophosphate-binding protein [Solwaraspora sp. WMMA2065]
MKVYQAIADALVDHRVDTVFGLLGDANMFLVADLVARHGVRFVAARNENAAVMMADGWARVTGRCAVATVTQGPGLAAAGPALTIARQAGTPLLLLAGDTPASDPLHVQNFPQQPFALATAGAFVPMTGVSTVSRDVAAGVREAVGRPGPVVLDIGLDLQDEPAGDRPAVPLGAAVAPAGPLPLAPDPMAVAGLADRLRRARHPVILAGRGAVHAGPELTALADRAGAVLVTSLMAAGLFAGHPYALGVAGGLARPLTRDVLREADLVVTFGACLNRWTADHGQLFGAAQVYSVDRDPAAIGARWPVHGGLVGDAALAARALTGALESARPGSEPDGWRTPQLARAIRDADPFAGLGPEPTGARHIDPRRLMAICARRLPLPRTTVVGVGHFGGWPNLYLDSPAVDRSLVAPWEFGSIGVGVAYAIGAALGRPDRPVVAFEGDGSLLTALGELDTLARVGAPVLVIVLDDGAYGAEVRKLRPAGADPGIARFPYRDLAAVAGALGVTAYRAHDEASVSAAFDALLPLTGPVLLHVKVDPDVVQQHF